MYNVIQVYLPTTEKLINQSDYASTRPMVELEVGTKSVARGIPPYL